MHLNRQKWYLDGVLVAACANSDLVTRLGSCEVTTQGKGRIRIKFRNLFCFYQKSKLVAQQARMSIGTRVREKGDISTR